MQLSEDFWEKEKQILTENINTPQILIIIADDREDSEMENRRK